MASTKGLYPMKTYRISVTTDNPDFLKRLKELVEGGNLDIDDGEYLRALDLIVALDGEAVWGTIYDPYQEED